MVNYYPPLFDFYHYQEVEEEANQITQTDDQENSDVEVYIEDESENYPHYEALPAVLDKLYKKRITYGLKSLYIYTSALIKGENALNLIENILNFKTEYLTTRNTKDESKVSILGLSIMRNAFHKIQAKAKFSSKLLKGMRILKRINYYKSKEILVKFWYQWKLYNSTCRKTEAKDIFETVSTVMNESKRKIIGSRRYESVSKDFSQHNMSVGKENYPLKENKVLRRHTKSKQRLDNLSRYFSKGSSQGSPQNFNTFVKNHHINDRDLIMANSTVKPSGPGKYSN